jgi:predicted RNA-binding protein with PIN domain
MDALPADAATGIVRGLGLYLRSAPVAEIPKDLRRFRGFRPATLGQHRDRLLAALDDPDLRAAILEWLDGDRPKLARTVASNLRLAVERPEGWREQLTAASPQRKASTSNKAALGRERERARSAREELKRARSRARTEIQAAEERIADLVAEVARGTAALSDAKEAASVAQRSAESARSELEREQRRARREITRARAERDEHKADARGARRDLTTASRELDRLRRRIEQLERSGAGRRVEPTPRAKPAPKKRRPLPVPPGRLPDDPQTLDEWLAGRGVHLVVDGYNAARVEGAFGELDLAGQRDRLVQEITGLATRRAAPATVVFDGAEVVPGVKRRRRGPVAIEYSKPSETADDHIVVLLERLPPQPVILVTNDRELQARAAERGATIATSDQLIGLIR